MQASFLLNSSGGFTASLDPRLKLLLCAGGSVATVAFSSAWSLMLLLAGATSLAFGATSHRMIAVVWLASSAMMLMTTTFSWFISQAVPGMFTWDLLRLSVPYLRMLVVVMLLVSLALSTPVQVMMQKLHALRLPGILSIPLCVAIRFIPTFIDDCKQIRDAARLRPSKGLRSLWRGIVVPLVFRMLSSADDLAVAAELKGVTPGKTAVTAPSPLFSRRDIWVLGSALLIMATAIVIQLLGPQTPQMGA